MNNSHDSTGALRRHCAAGLRRRHGIDIDNVAASDQATRDLAARLDGELAALAAAGLVEVFDHLRELVHEAWRRGIPTGPGWGSLCGSLTAYACGLSEVDPLRHGLLFERFLPGTGKEPPQLAVEVPGSRREELVHWLAGRHGTDRLARVGVAVGDAADRRFTAHAASFVIADVPLSGRVPVAHGDDGIPVCQLSERDCPRYGLVAFDILGNPDLDKALAAGLVPQEGIGLSEIPLDDPGTFERLSRSLASDRAPLGDAVALCRGPGIRSIDDLALVMALAFPGPRRHVPEMLRRRTGVAPAEPVHPALRPILAETCGMMVFQEQVMRTAQALAGISPAESDVLRRDIAKPDADRLAAWERRFLDGCASRGLAQDAAAAVWGEIRRAAPIAFCKAHATGRAMLACRTGVAQSAWQCV
jgi:DNA polymerase-3 subunit alpha